MHAFLLATGEGNKLAPLSTSIAAPMLPIANRPVMAYAVELLARAGFHHSFVSLYQFPDSIERYFGNGQRWNLQLQYLMQRQGWGTAGAFKRAAHALSATFLVLPADALIDLEIDAALAFHQQHGGPATVILSQARCATTAAHEMLQLSHDGRILGLDAVTTDSGYYRNVGAYIFEPSVLAHIPAKSVFDCHPQLLRALIQAGEAVHGYVMKGYWNPLRSFTDFQAAQHTYLDGLMGAGTRDQTQALRYLLAEGREISRGVWCGQGSTIHPTVRLAPPIYIGAHCQIGRQVELGPTVVIGAHSIIEEGATIQQSTILPNSYIGRLVNLDQRIVHKNLLIDVQTSAHVQITDRFLLAETDAALASNILRNLLERGLALLLLGLTAPLLLCLALWIWLTTGKRPLVGRPYVGSKPRLGRAKDAPRPQPITLFHLRTRLADNRYTSLGRWLEEWELHRLPELWHVLGGELGLVGVKPLTVEEAQQITEAWQQKRYDEQIGFTGLWYTAAGAHSTFDEICVFDTYQAATYTWQSNLQQLIRTPAAWLTRGRAPNHKQATASSQPYEESLRPYTQFVNASVGKSAPRDSHVH